MSDFNAEAILNTFRTELNSADNVEQIDDIRRRYTGRKSPIKSAMNALRSFPKEQRPLVAESLNLTKGQIEVELGEALKTMRRREVESRLAHEWQDLSMPGLITPRGARHPVSIVERQCMDVLRRLGFELVDGPEVESSYFTFDALNMPEYHPARDMQDTFWLNDSHVLRTHTTTVQARVLADSPQLPVKIASGGRVYRNETVDATHLAMFHQFEGLWVEQGLTFAHLKGVLSFIGKELFGERPLRFKPKYYPYTEPSVGVDIQCVHCLGNGCSACHGAGWVTILGAGMVHPKVFLEFDFDPNTVSGIAFGLGTTRMASQWAGVSAVRNLYRFDNRLLKTIHQGGSK